MYPLTVEPVHSVLLMRSMIPHGQTGRRNKQPDSYCQIRLIDDRPCMHCNRLAKNACSNRHKREQKVFTVLPEPTEPILSNKLRIYLGKRLTLSGKYEYARHGVNHPISKLDRFFEPTSRLAMPFRRSSSEWGHVIVIRKPF